MNLADRRRVDRIQKRIKRIVDGRKVAISAIAVKAHVDNGTVKAVYERNGHAKQTISTRTAGKLESGLDELERSMGMVKTCARCGKELPVGRFNSHSSSSDGLQSYCIECHKEYKRKAKETKVNNNKENAITAETVRRVREEDKRDVESKFMAPYFSITPKQLDEIRRGTWDKLLYATDKPKRANTVLEAVESLRDEVAQLRTEVRAVMVELGIEVRS